MLLPDLLLCWPPDQLTLEDPKLLHIGSIHLFVGLNLYSLTHWEQMPPIIYVFHLCPENVLHVFMDMQEGLFTVLFNETAPDRFLGQTGILDTDIDKYIYIYIALLSLKKCHYFSKRTEVRSWLPSHYYTVKLCALGMLWCHLVSTG